LICATTENPNAHFIEPEYHHSAYLLLELTLLFAEYPKLSVLEWVTNYPTNLLEDELPPSWPEQDVLHRVSRDISNGTDPIRLIDTSRQLTSARVKKEQG
jgi:hypothetical protein